jgi:hypothetical protein
VIIFMLGLISEQIALLRMEQSASFMLGHKGVRHESD